jgi:HSP20 family protein
MDRFFEDSFGPPVWGAFRDGHTIPLDVYQTEDALVVKATLPGLKPEEVEITIEGDSLSIRGEVKAEEEKKMGEYLYHERHHGTFSRALVLPSGLRTDKAEATFENGVLTLTIPKAEEIKPKRISIKAKELVEGKK